MPGWLIDLFGSRKLNEIFWALTLAPLPVWICLIFFPRRRFTRKVTSIYFMPVILGASYLFLVWKLRAIGTPDLPSDTAARSTRIFLFHPIVFLVLWSHLQMANLFVGIILLQDSRRRGHRVPVELALCWLFAPVAVLLYSVRRLVWYRRLRRALRR